MSAPTACSAEQGAPVVRRRASDALLDAVATAGATILGWLPWRAALGIGCTLGWIAGSLSGHRRTRAIANLARAGSPDPRRACRRIRCHAGRTLMEIAWSLNRSPETIRRHLVVENLAGLRDAAAAGRGVLVLSAHMDNWEMVGLAATLAGAPVAAVARTMRTPRLERRLIAFRERCGIRTLRRQQAGTSLAAARWLQRGGVFACLTDRASSGRRVALPFLGATTKVPTGPFDLACRLGARIVVGSATRLADGTTRVTFTPIEEAAGCDGRRPDPIAIARLVLQTLERDLGSEPERWLWIGRRQTFGAATPTLPARRADPARLAQSIRP